MGRFYALKATLQPPHTTRSSDVVLAATPNQASLAQRRAFSSADMRIILLCLRYVFSKIWVEFDVLPSCSHPLLHVVFDLMSVNVYWMLYIVLFSRVILHSIDGAWAASRLVNSLLCAEVVEHLRCHSRVKHRGMDTGESSLSLAHNIVGIQHRSWFEFGGNTLLSVIFAEFDILKPWASRCDHRR